MKFLYLVFILHFYAEIIPSYGFGYEYNPILSEKVGIPPIHYRGPLAFDLNPNDFATWSNWADCPSGGVLTGLQLKTYSNTTDQAGIVGIKIFCKIPWEEEILQIVMDSVPWGIWGDPFMCDRGLSVGFQVKMEPHLNFLGDFKGISDIAIYCINIGGDLSLKKSGQNESDTWGSWKEPKICAQTEAICRLRIYQDVEPSDKSGFHGLEMGCCNDIDVDYINVFLTRNQHKKNSGKILYMPVLNSNSFSVGQKPEDYFLSFPYKQHEFDFPYWQNWHFCKHPEFIVGYKFKLNRITKQIHDIKFLCQNPLNPGVRASIGSGRDQEMTKEILCPTSTYAIGINVLYNSRKFIKNIRLFCSVKKNENNSSEKRYIQMDLNSTSLYDTRWRTQQNLNFGRNVGVSNPQFEIRMVEEAKNNSEIEGWIEPEFCSPSQAICGFKLNAGAKVVGDNGPIDLRMNCCEIQDPAFYCKLQDKWDLVYQCDRRLSNSRATCSYTKRNGFSRTNQYTTDQSLQNEFRNITRVDNSQLYRETNGIGYTESDDVSFTNSYNRLLSTGNSISNGTRQEASSSILQGTRDINSVDQTNSQTDSNTNSAGSSALSSNTATNSEQTSGSQNSWSSQSNTKEVSNNQHSSTHVGASVEVSTSVTAGFNIGIASGSATVGTKVSASTDFNWGQSTTDTRRNTEDSGQSSTHGWSNDNSKSQTEQKTLENRFEKTTAQMASINRGQQNENNLQVNRGVTMGRQVDQTFSAEEKFGIDASHRVDKRLQKNRDRTISSDASRLFSMGQDSGRIHSTSWSQSSMETWNEEVTITANIEVEERSSIRVCQLVGSCSNFQVRSVLIKIVDEPYNCNDIYTQEETR